MDETSPLYLVTGGYGFIGCHLVNHLLWHGCRVRIADSASSASFPISGRVDFHQGDLREAAFCQKVVDGVQVVVHLAANMGGMGTIHDSNDFIIYRDNHTMTQNLAHAAISARVPKFFYASSACVYPDDLQGPDQNVELEEDTAGRGPPQGLYGLEKLHSEWYLRQMSKEHEGFQIRIARFHNIFGPGGAWDNGREKAPAALLRKVHAIRRGSSLPGSLEIWGDGTQRRSFLFIEDAVRAVWSLIHSDHSEPINIGSDRSVSIRDLVRIAADCVDLSDSDLNVTTSHSGPTGVASRNASLAIVRTVLGWTPRVSLEEGMRQTSAWIGQQMDESTRELSTEHKKEFLGQCLNSKLIYLGHDEPSIMAILVPITSRGTSDPDECLTHLKSFAQSLIYSTQKDVASGRYRVKIYLAIDHDDDYLLSSDAGQPNRAEAVLTKEGIHDTSTLICHFPRGHVCALWRAIARRAYNDGCDFFLLAGDDVVFVDENWLSAAVSEFTTIAETRLLLPGLACVAFTDETFPGMPTFPIIHRSHMEIFDGKVVPDVFVNQDGDPYLFQLYRRWGASTMFSKRIRNTKGGEHEARYTKLHVADWTIGALENGVGRVRDYLSRRGSLAQEFLALDIIIPSYRVDITLLKGIVELRPSPTCAPMFIIIVDDPTSASYHELMRLCGVRSDIRIRRNTKNLGAPASRNRGLSESAGEWVHFLDDDVVPDPDLLVQSERAIRAQPDAAGFVGLTRFPPATTIFTTAVHLAGVTYFWGIANQPSFANDVPWGVTANLIARRVIRDRVVQYDLAYPKTGGGEDIDYCRQQRDLSTGTGGKAFIAAPGVAATHPWWNQGNRSYWRFYGWSKGDGRLIKRYSDLTYIDVPNTAELLIFSLSIAAGGSLWRAVSGRPSIAIAGLRGGVAIMLANIGHDLYRHLWRDRERTKSIDSTVRGLRWTLAIMESTLIRVWSEVGRTVGIFERGELSSLFRRFDWFCKVGGMGPRREERRNNTQRLFLALAILSGLLFVRN